jgi:hypothetical protein
LRGSRDNHDELLESVSRSVFEDAINVVVGFSVVDLDEVGKILAEVVKAVEDPLLDEGLMHKRQSYFPQNFAIAFFPKTILSQ